MFNDLDLAAEALSIESLFKSDLDGALDLLEKGVGHKYLRRIGAPGHYRYFYSPTHAAMGGSDPQLGEKVKVDDGGQEGHFEVTHLHGDGHVTIKHDVTGKTMKVHKDQLRDMLREEHGPAIAERGRQLRRVHDQAMKTGTPRQQERASAALNAHNMAFEGKSYAKNRAYALAVSDRVLNDKWATTHNHHEAIGAHVVAAGLAPSSEERAHHMEMVEKHGKALDELRDQIDARDAKKVSEAADRESRRADASGSDSAHRTAAQAHLNAQERNEKVDPKLAHTHGVLAAHHTKLAQEAEAARIASDPGHPNHEAAKQASPTEQLKEATKPLEAAKSHEDIVKEAHKALMGEGRNTPKKLQRYDDATGKLHQKTVGDKQTISKEEVGSMHAHIGNLRRMAKEKGGKGKALAALKEARDHWRYMAGLHNGRYEATRRKAGGSRDEGKTADDHHTNMIRARGMRDELDAAMHNIRTRADEGVPPDTVKHKAPDIREGDSERVQNEKNIRHAQRSSKPKSQQHAEHMAKQAAGARKMNPLGAPSNAEDRFGPKSFFENVDRDEHEATGKQHIEPRFNPDEYKDLPKGSTLHVYAPNQTGGDKTQDLHLYRHEGHGELKPLGNSSKEVNHVNQLKGHDVSISEPGDTRTGDLFSEGAKRVAQHRKEHNDYYSKMSLSDPKGDLSKGEDAEDGSRYDGRTVQKNAIELLKEGASLVKGGGGFHKYITRMGGPGNYRYVYSQPAKHTEGDQYDPKRSAEAAAYHEKHGKNPLKLHHLHEGADILAEKAKAGGSLDWNGPEADAYEKHHGVRPTKGHHLKEGAELLAKQKGSQGSGGWNGSAAQAFEKHYGYKPYKGHHLREGERILANPNHHDPEYGERAQKGVTVTEVIHGRNAVGVEPADDRRTHAGRLRRPAQAEYRIVDSAPALVGPNQGVVRSLAIGRVEREMKKAILDSYRHELMQLENGNETIQTIKKQASAYSRLSVPRHLIKSLNVGNPDDDAVVAGAIARLKVLAKAEAQVRQGLAILKVGPRDVLEAFLRMGLTPARVYAGSV